jgi:hypothetical protein
LGGRRALPWLPHGWWTAARNGQRLVPRGRCDRPGCGGPPRATDTSLRLSVDVISAEWQKCLASGGRADRRAKAQNLAGPKAVSSAEALHAQSARAPVRRSGLATAVPSAHLVFCQGPSWHPPFGGITPQPSRTRTAGWTRRSARRDGSNQNLVDRMQHRKASGRGTRRQRSQPGAVSVPRVGRGNCAGRTGRFPLLSLALVGTLGRYE